MGTEHLHSANWIPLPQSSVKTLVENMRLELHVTLSRR